MVVVVVFQLTLPRDSNAQIVYAMCEPDFRKVYSPWNDYVPNPKATITTLYDFTMSRMAQLQEYNHRLVIKELQSHTLPPVAASAPEVAAPGPTDDDRYITLSTGEKLLKPPPAPGSKSASDSSGLPPKYGFLPPPGHGGPHKGLNSRLISPDHKALFLWWGYIWGGVGWLAMTLVCSMPVCHIS